MKIYAVTKGDYSDYHIVALTLDKKKAKEMAKLHTYKFKYKDDPKEYVDEAWVEEYEDGEELVLPTWRVWFSEGNVEQAEMSDFEWEDEAINESYVRVNAKDKESAIKIASEKRAMWLAEKEGIV